MVVPCEPWPYSCVDWPEDPSSEEQALIDSAVMAATEILWNRTKRQFGTCEIIVRPCRRSCWPSSTWASWLPHWNDISGLGWPFPALVGGKWMNLGCGGCGSDCSCSVLHEVILPYPTSEVLEVRIDGIVLPPTAYRVDNHRSLLRLDGEPWPLCNDLNKEDTEEGTWSVTLLVGLPVPESGQMAVGQLASAIYKACVGDKSCPLPSTTVRSITRQGVSKVFFDPTDAFKKGKIGLYWPDLFIHTFNPSGTGVASIFNIDGPRRRTTTSPGA